MLHLSLVKLVATVRYFIRQDAPEHIKINLIRLAESILYKSIQMYCKTMKMDD